MLKRGFVVAMAAEVSRKTLEPLTAAEAAALVRALAKIG